MQVSEWAYGLLIVPTWMSFTKACAVPSPIRITLIVCLPTKSYS